MRAAVIHAAGDLRLEERPEPAPAPGDVLVRFGAGGICGSDLSYWGKGSFDIGFEATGAPTALASLVRAVRPGGRIVQRSMMPPGEVGVPVDMLMAQEIDLFGAFHFCGEFRTAVDWLACDRIDVSPVMSAEMPMSDPSQAFEMAADRPRAIKVHLHF